MDSGKMQIQGTKASMQERAPLNVEPGMTGGGTMQISGTKAGISTTPSGMNEFSKNIPANSSQIMGTKAALNPTPVKGWGDRTPMSDRTHAQSQGGK